MGHESEERNEAWGNDVARATFIATLIFAALFIGAVFIFIL